MEPVRRRGVTLLEVLVSTAVLAVMVLMVWQLASGTLRAFSTGAWYSATTRELRTGLIRVAEDLSRASYPSVLTPTTMVISLDDDRHFTHLRTGKTDLARAPAGQTLPLIAFWLCRPHRTGLPEGQNSERLQIQARLEARGSTLHYRKVAHFGEPLPRDLFDADLVHNVASITIDLPDRSPGNGRRAVRIRMRTANPGDPRQSAEQVITARIAVDVKPLDGPSVPGYLAFPR